MQRLVAQAARASSASPTRWTTRAPTTCDLSERTQSSPSSHAHSWRFVSDAPKAQRAKMKNPPNSDFYSPQEEQPDHHQDRQQDRQRVDDDVPEEPRRRG